MSAEGRAVERGAEHVIAKVVEAAGVREATPLLAERALSKGSRQASAAETLTSLERGARKVPDEWGKGAPNKKGIGSRWFDPKDPKGRGVRIDQGNPASPLPGQRVDHVVVRDGGRIVGPDGNPIIGSLKKIHKLTHRYHIGLAGSHGTLRHDRFDSLSGNA
jgi:hypothetical protein